MISICWHCFMGDNIMFYLKSDDYCLIADDEVEEELLGEEEEDDA